MVVAVYVGMARPEPAITLTAFISVPAAVIAVANLYGTAHLQRSAYIKDYAIKFRTDKELSESFHYLVVNFGNKEFAAHEKKSTQRSAEEQAMLDEAQKELPSDVRFFDPQRLVGSPQERRLDNLLGFFDALGYDYLRGLVTLDDVSGMFGLQLEHFNQREAVKQYIHHVRGSWANMRSFQSVVEPYTYLSYLLEDYKKYCEKEHAMQRVRSRLRRERV